MFNTQSIFDRSKPVNFWLGVVLIILVWLLNLTEDVYIPLWQRLILSTLLTIVLIITFHLSKYYFRRIQIGQSRWYTLALILIGLSFLGALTNSIFLDPHEQAKYEGESYISVLFFDILATLPVTITMVFSWAFYMFDRNKENELAISRLTALNKESELSELKKQLNPHFLFNALSNIYSIAYLKDENTPDKILQLSKMLRYVIYETDVEFISLSKEIEYIKYYIDFQKFKIKKEQQIDFDCQEIQDGIVVAPLIFLPFIENAFKHSHVATEPDAWVSIKLRAGNDQVHFSIENTISQNCRPEILNNPGIGLENIKKRLDLIYKSNAELEIIQKDTFRVELKMNIS